jgi:hypothetical protein
MDRLNAIKRTCSYARVCARFIAPYGVIELIKRRRFRKKIAADNVRAAAFKRAVRELGRPPAASFTWSDANSFLSGLGCDRSQVSDGSIPEQSLNYSSDLLKRHIKARPALGLHVGNFVGISLCHYVDFARRLDAKSMVVSIDPNLTHRGISNPMQMVINCLNHFGLQDNAMILTGYSLEKSVSNDGVAITADYDPQAAFGTEMSCENQLPALARLMAGQFDFAVIDGNHEGSYLGREVGFVHALLKPAGVLVMDDVDWSELGVVYTTLDPEQFEQLGTDGRVGLARKRLLEFSSCP